MITVVFALTSSVVVGVSDYLGGRAGEQQHPALVTAYAQATYLLMVPLIAVIVGWEQVAARDIWLGLACGVLVGASYILFFSALASGRMGIAAPTTAAISASIPVAYDLLSGVQLSTGRWVGVAVALAAVPLLAYAPDDIGDKPGRASSKVVLLTAALAGLGFSGFFILLGETSPESGQWPLAASSLSSTLAVVAFVALRRVPLARPVPGAIWSGATGAVAGALITAALQRGPVAVATVLGSMYPIVTVGLAARLAAERIRWWHAAGLGLAVCGAALVGFYA
ncbi:MAG: DMT family transporter [Actinomycetota bacterium]|nr:MAG: DMT family transporter [Actinomycetota bacterium]